MLDFHFNFCGRQGYISDYGLLETLLWFMSCPVPEIKRKCGGNQKLRWRRTIPWKAFSPSNETRELSSHFFLSP